MAKAQTKPLLTSKREWLRQLLLARLRRVDQVHLNDAALKHLAATAARRLSRSSLGYRELNIMLASAPSCRRAIRVKVYAD
ncbi:hypothetical protein GC173_12200 [bacterium]|nr:hypothetical protein [bacterium]